MVVGAIVDEKGHLICCEMWPGNTADVTSLLPIINRLRKRFAIGRCCIVADRGMISDKTLQMLDCGLPMQYILGVRMRKFKTAAKVLSHAGRYREVTPEGAGSKDPSPLKVKEVIHDDVRYIVCVNSRQAIKVPRPLIWHSLRSSLKTG